MDGMKGTPRPRQHLYEMIDRMEEQPTAYNVDKVVKELENESFPTHENYSAIWYDKAIEIVKQGGVSDDVCEWRIFDNSLTDEPQWVYKTTCGKYIGEEHTSKAFVYCPYCSKKIKVVE